MDAASLSGRTAIVTGGAGHLGRHICRMLVAHGVRVIAIDRDGAFDVQAGDLATGEVETGDAILDGIPRKACDLTDEAAVAVAFKEIWSDHGPISILVNAVGRIYSAPLINIASTDRRHSLLAFRQTLDANLVTVFLATVALVDLMVATRTRGVVVSLGSIAASGNTGQTAYSAAKAGVNAMTMTWAKELGPLGIRFVAVAPGFIDTGSTRDALSQQAIDEWKRRTPLRKLGSMDDVAAAVLFAIDSAYITGKVIEVDGGLTL